MAITGANNKRCITYLIFNREQNFAPTLNNLRAFRVNWGICPSGPLNFEPCHVGFVGSLANGRCHSNLERIIFKLIKVFLRSYYRIVTWAMALKLISDWVPQNLNNERSTLVAVMAWCRQATSYYLSQCCPRSMSPYHITRSPWVNSKGHHTTSYTGLISSQFSEIESQSKWPNSKYYRDLCILSSR